MDCCSDGPEVTMAITTRRQTLFSRLVYGRPELVYDDRYREHVAARPLTALVGRTLLAAIFLISAAGKAMHPAETIAQMQSVGISGAGFWIWVAFAAELFGGLALLFGFLTPIAALGLIAFLIPTTLYFHAFWNVAADQRMAQMIHFLKNVGLAGGLAMVFAHGPSRYSVDDRLRRPRDS
jgi:putative oxidoreductase